MTVSIKTNANFKNNFCNNHYAVDNAAFINRALASYNKYNAPINFALPPTPYSALLNKCTTPNEPGDDFSNIQSQIKYNTIRTKLHDS